MAKRSARIEELREKSEYLSYYPRKLDRPSSFDGECRRIQCEANLASATVDASKRSLWDLIRDEVYTRNGITNKQAMVKELQWTQTNFERIDHLSKTKKTARKKSQKAYRSSSSHLNNSARLMQQQSSASAQMSFNNLAVGAKLGTVSTLNHCEEVRMSEGRGRSFLLTKHDQVDEKNMQQAQMIAKAFVDQMFADRKNICREGSRIESRPFSDALEVLSAGKDLFADKTVVLKAEPQNRTHSGKFACHCSSRQSDDILSSRVSKGRRTSFSVREIKRKLKLTFGRTKKEPDQISVCGTSSKLSHSGSIFGDDCIYRGVETRAPLSYSTNAKTKEKLGKKQGLKPGREPDTARETNPVRKKIDVSSGRFSDKHEVDVVLQTNRHPSARLNDLNASGTMSERSSKTLETIISALEHDFWPFSPRSDSQCCSGNGQMRFSSCSASHTPNERQRLCLSPMRITSCDGYEECDDTTEMTISSTIPSTDEEAQDTMSSATGNVKPNDEPNIVKTNICNSEAQNEINSNTRRTAKIEMHSVYNSLSDSERFTNTVDDFPSTPTSIHQSDTPESSKYQEEHQSPVSVLDQFFAEDVKSPTAGHPLKPRQLRFEECSFDSSPQHEQYFVSHYVHLVFQASCLNWDQLSEIRPLSDQKLLHPSLFDEVEFLLPDSRTDTRLLFDHMNEVLLEIQRSHFSSSSSCSATFKPRICCVPLREVVLGEIMREAELYLHPRTQERTLEQIVAKDVADCRLWLDLRPETEHIMIHISEDILEELILDVLMLQIRC